jgi:hypothetical protein
MTSFDPDFDRPAKDRKAGRQRTIQRRSVILAVGLAAIWLIILRDTGVLWFVLGVFGLFVCGVLVMVLAMVPGLVGFKLFAAFDRMVAAYRRAGRWPDDEATDGHPE